MARKTIEKSDPVDMLPNRSLLPHWLPWVALAVGLIYVGRSAQHAQHVSHLFEWRWQTDQRVSTGISPRVEENGRLFQAYCRNGFKPTPEQLAPLLASTTPEVVEKTVRALGRTEGDSAIAILSRASLEISHSKWEARSREDIQRFIDFSIARIQYRHLKGRARLDATLGAVGLSFNDIVSSTARLKSEAHITSKGWSTVGGCLVKEVIHLMLSMEAQGERNGDLFKQLTLNHGAKALFQAANLPPSQRIDTLLTRATDISTSALYQGDGGVELHLMFLQHDLSPGLKKAITRVNANRTRYPAFTSYETLFNLAAIRGDVSLIPALQKLRDHKYPSVRVDSQYAVRKIKDDVDTENPYPISYFELE
ncbi:hypothetical protein EON80_23050 [bacterium]|nr:MAG: hypothetical protein EON80_23050 [bacterium]